MQTILFLVIGVIAGILIEARYGPAIQGIHARLDADAKALDVRLMAQMRALLAYMKDEIAKVRNELATKPVDSSPESEVKQ